MEKRYQIYKQIGETPLEALERFRRMQIEKETDLDSKRNWQIVPMTYAGRLDPMAEGELLILIGDECKNKEKYLSLDKEYEVEVLFGVETDTHDVLGMIVEVEHHLDTKVPPRPDHLQKYVGKFIQSYPSYSSKTVNGIQLHELARADKLPKEMPTKGVEIYSIEDLGTRHITGNKIAEYAIKNISKVLGDFRQEEIISGWNNFQGKYGNESFSVLKIKVRCSSGTYMRSLASRMGQDVGTGALALSIKRTWIDYPQQ